MPKPFGFWTPPFGTLDPMGIGGGPRGRGRPAPRPGQEGGGVTPPSPPGGGPPPHPFGHHPFSPFGGGPPDFNRPFDALRSIFKRASRARRGDVRAAILMLLNEAPRNGYQLIQELEQRTRGGWKPSPGSIYPTLEQLEDEGLVRVERGGKEEGSSRTFALTEAGKRYVADHAEELGSEPWSAFVEGGESELRKEVFSTFRQVGIAMGQVIHGGNAKQIAKAKKVLAKARRELYRVLADGEEEP